MTSEKRRAANRANALKSTGPKTKEGKIQSSRNAFKHGLAAATAPSASLGEDGAKLERMLAGGKHSSGVVLGARRAAQSIVLRRNIRAVIARTVSALANVDADTFVSECAKLYRYDKRINSRIRKDIRSLRLSLEDKVID